MLFDKGNENDKDIKIKIKYNIYEDKSKIKTNFDYNNYKNKEEFLNEININEDINKDNSNDIKRKKSYKKEKSKKKKSIKDKTFKNILAYQENNIKNNNTNYFNDKDNSDYHRNKKNLTQYNFNYLKSENNKNNKLNRKSETNINKESKVKINRLNINNKEKAKYNNYENKNKTAYNKMKLKLLNNNEEDINCIKINNYNDIKDDYTKNTTENINYDGNNDTNKNYTSSISISQNEDINNIKYIENENYQFTYIYSLIGQDLISFNINEKKFEIISVKDKTNGIFNSYIAYYHENKLYPLLLNTPKGFYILLNKYIFCYDQITNSISTLIKLYSYHTNGNFIYIRNDLYSISGINTTQCEKYSLNSNNNILLPETNFPRINSGICNVNNEYIYVFFGKFCENSIERLYIGNNNNYYNDNDKWEIVRINEINGFNDNKICLSKFVTFLDDFSNIIIFGGEDCKEKENNNIFGFNLNNNNISIIGKIDSCSLYSSQFIMLDESIFSIFDINNGLHFFNKELDYHEIFNLNV